MSSGRFARESQLTALRRRRERKTGDDDVNRQSASGHTGEKHAGQLLFPMLILSIRPDAANVRVFFAIESKCAASSADQRTR